MVSPEQSETTAMEKGLHSNESRSNPEILYDNSHQWKVFQSVLKKLKEYPAGNNIISEISREK